MVDRLSQLNNHFTDSEIADVAIIGAGVCGLSTAVNLKKRKVDKIVIVDTYEKIGSLSKASNVNCGIVCAPAHVAPSPLDEEMLKLT